MRARMMVIGLLQAAMLVACERTPKIPGRSDDGKAVNTGAYRGSVPEASGKVDQPAVDRAEVASEVQQGEQWFGSTAVDPASRLIIRTGQASIEVDSLGPAMAELRRIVQRVGGFAAGGSVPRGRHQ